MGYIPGHIGIYPDGGSYLPEVHVDQAQPCGVAHQLEGRVQATGTQTVRVVRTRPRAGNPPIPAGRAVLSVDDPATLRQYAQDLGAADHWSFLTGDSNYIRRVGSEFLGIAADGPHHSTRLVVVDRWGNVRGRIDWQHDDSRQQILELIDQLNDESVPSADFDVITSNPGSQP